MSNYLGRLVDRAVGPPAAAASPRLAPVFLLGRARKPGPELLDSEAAPRRRPVPREAKPEPRRPAPTPEVASPPADAPERSVTPTPSATARELREIHVEHAAPESREPVAPVAPLAQEPSPTEVRTHEHTVERSVGRREAEPARPAKPPAVAAPRVVRAPLPATARIASPVQQAPRIEVRIGRVEIRRPAVPDPVEWPAPVADAPAVAAFGALAASRRYVDRRWS